MKTTEEEQVRDIVGDTDFTPKFRAMMLLGIIAEILLRIEKKLEHPSDEKNEEKP